jgi:hypothetical protein
MVLPAWTSCPAICRSVMPATNSCRTSFSRSEKVGLATIRLKRRGTQTSPPGPRDRGSRGVRRLAPADTSIRARAQRLAD